MGACRLGGYHVTITASTHDREDFLRRMADYERLSGILWIVLACLQIVSVVAIIAGVWNLFAGLSRLGMAKKVRRGDADVPAAYEGAAQLIIIALINLFLGAVIGIAFVFFDYYIRDQILGHRQYFGLPAAAGVEGGRIVAPPAPRPGAPAPSRSAVEGSVVAELERLAALRDRGVLDEGEFQQEKRRLLGGRP